MRFFLATLLLATTCAGSALAQTPEHARAEQLFVRGRDLARAKRCQDAVVALRASVDAEPSIGAYLNLGDCLVKLDRPEEAWQAYKAAESMAQQRSDPRLALTREDVARLEASCVRVSIRLPDDVADARVTIDETVIVRERLAHVLLTAEETHDIHVRAPSRRPWHAQVRASAGAVRQLDVVFPDEVAPAPITASPAPTPPPSVRAPEPETHRSEPSPIAWPIFAGGVGAAALVTGAVFGVLALDTRGDVDDKTKAAGCRGSYPDTICSGAARAELEPLESKAMTQATLSTVFFAIGGAAVATGVVLHFWPLGSAKSSAKVGLGHATWEVKW